MPGISLPGYLFRGCALLDEVVVALEALHRYGGVWVRDGYEPNGVLSIASVSEKTIVFTKNRRLCALAAPRGSRTIQNVLQKMAEIAMGGSPDGETQKALGLADFETENVWTTVEGKDTICHKESELFEKASDELPGSINDPERLLIVIKTIDRDPQYIHQTLASLFTSDALLRRCGEVVLLVGGEGTDYLRNYLHHRHIRVISLSDAEREQVSELKILKMRAAFNRRRSFSIPLRGQAGMLILEDDVVFRDGFLRLLLQTLAELRSAFPLEEFGLALFSPHDFERYKERHVHGRVCTYELPFSATQAVYYSAASLPGLAKQITLNCLDVYRMPGDIAVGRHLRGKLFATYRFLAQHIGEISTGLGGTSMNQDVFHRPFVAVTAEEWGEPEISAFPCVPFSLFS
jgi:hypothetical protein